MRKLIAALLASSALLPQAALAAADETAEATAAAAAEEAEIIVLGRGETRQVQEVSQRDIAVLLPGTSAIRAIEKLPSVNVQSADAFGNYEWSTRVTIRSFIASFQALRYRLADMQLAALQAQALTEQAVTALASADGDAKVSLAAACVAVRDAARTVGEGAVQLHGAMGLTEELRLGARFKRVLAIAAGLGSEAEVLSRFADAA